MNRWVSALLVVDFLLFLGFGAAFLIAPADLLALLDIRLGSPAAFTEVRAMYGGLELAVAVFVAGVRFGWVRAQEALLICALLLAGLGLTRLISLGLLGFHSLHAMLLSAEFLGSVTNFIAWRYLRRGP